MTKDHALEIGLKLERLEARRRGALNQLHEIGVAEKELEKEVHEALPKLSSFRGPRLGFVLAGGNWGTNGREDT